MLKPWRQFSLAQLLTAVACFAGSLAAITGIVIPACDGAFDLHPFGFYAILMGAIASSLSAAVGMWVLTRRIFAGIVSGIGAFVAINVFIRYFLW